MVLTTRLARKLGETLGPEASEDLVDWMRTVETREADLRAMHELTYARFESRLDQKFSELQHEMQLGFAHATTQMAELRGEMVETRRQSEAGIANLEIRMERRFADLMKWSFVFWIGSLVTLVGTLAALERFAR